MTPDIDQTITAAHTALETARRAVAAEISAYPTPISGCDAQFNHLLALRMQIGSALDALDAQVFVPTPRLQAPGMRMESR